MSQKNLNLIDERTENASPFHRLIQMMERGMLFKFKKDYLASFYGTCGKFRKRDDDAGLGMADVFSAFLFLGVTQIIVFVLIATETVYSKVYGNE